MPEHFSDWLQKNFLAETRQAPANGQPVPHCSGDKDKCFAHVLDLLDNRLSDEVGDIMKANIESCRACYDEMDMQVIIRTALQHKLKHEAIPAQLLQDIRHKIAEMA